jgi:uncharacterized repeat protein (TIGR03803 family)
MLGCSCPDQLTTNPDMSRSSKFNRGLLLCLLAAGFCGGLAQSALAQSFTVLHSFTPMATNAVGIYTNSDGAAAKGALVLSGNILYGACTQGGPSGGGTIFAVNIDGSGFKVLHAFTPLDNGNNTDGSYAQFFFINNSEYVVGQDPGLIMADGKLYGTTGSGGLWAGGTVFAMNVDGSGFTNLHSFNSGNSEGHYPHGGLVVSGRSLYGTTGYYGAGGSSIYAIGTDGSGFTNLHTFSGGDGIGPNGLVLFGDTLFGTTYFGGGTSFFPASYGTVFSLRVDGTGFNVLYSFGSGSDGDPQAGVAVSDGTIYGITPSLVFKLSSSGESFWILHRFDAPGVNTSGLTLSANTLYGTDGTLFAVNTDGTGFTNLYSFTPTAPSGAPPFFSTNTDGASPAGQLILSGRTLYGTTEMAGSGGSGTVFKLWLSPPLAVLAAGSDLVLTWPTNAVGFRLQAAPDLLSSTSWTNVLQSPSVLDGQNLVILPVSGASGFYRLSH